MESARAATAVCSLPPCGGGLGRGVVVMAQSCIRQLLPPPPTPPQPAAGLPASGTYESDQPRQAGVGWGGEHTVRVATVLHPTERDPL